MSGEKPIWIQNLAKNLIKSIEIKIGDVVLDKIDNNYNKLINHYDALIDDKVISHIPLDSHRNNNNIIFQKENIFFQNPDDIFIDL
jgi:hypothetical protein